MAYTIFPIWIINVGIKVKVGLIVYIYTICGKIQMAVMNYTAAVTFSSPLVLHSRGCL